MSKVIKKDSRYFRWQQVLQRSEVWLWDGVVWAWGHGAAAPIGWSGRLPGGGDMRKDLL